MPVGEDARAAQGTGTMAARDLGRIQRAPFGPGCDRAGGGSTRVMYSLALICVTTVVGLGFITRCKEHVT